MEKCKMFCPHCGDPLVLKSAIGGREDPYCVRGDMYLSQVVRRKLEERFCNPEGTEPVLPVSRRFRPGGHWFCPGDGEVLDEYLECSKCGKHINDLAYMLIELHPHKDKNGWW
jgi:hypothetical protein